MSRYDVIGRMNACFVELEQALGALQQQITAALAGSAGVQPA